MSLDSAGEDSTRSFVIPTPGARLAQYEIVDHIGTGGMGEIFLARDANLDRQVALKFLPANMTVDPMFRERFSREARSAAALNHPNVVTIYEVAEVAERVFIAMEYVDGRSVRALIDSGKLTPTETVNLIGQICDGLGAAHSRNMVHRDVKPLNVIVDRSGRVRILDFGLAKAESDQQLTQAGIAMGTVSYMSPEQGQGQEVDYRSDIFSVGVMLYEMLTGKLPFDRGNMPATIYAIVHDAPEAMNSLRPGLPDKLQSVVDRAIAKRPEDRYQSLAELKIDLIAAVSRVPVVEVEPPVRDVKSLAVLYLQNNGSSDDEYLCYGITEDLIIDLTRLGGVRVATMRSVMKYKNSDADIEEIAERLNVGLVLDGSIFKGPETVRVSAQLVRADTGENVWAQRWEEPADQLPRIKQALAEGISRALNVGQSTLLAAGVGSPQAQDATAYDNYLKAKYHFENKKSASDIDIAVGFYALALKDEPGLLAARAGLAEIQMHNGDFASAEIELTSALTEAVSRNSKPDQVQMHRLLAKLNLGRSDYALAEEHAEQAVALSAEIKDLAGETAALAVLIAVLQPQARFEETMPLFDRVLQISRDLDDQDTAAEALKNMGVAFSRQGEYDRALDLYEEAKELAGRRGNLELQASIYSNIGNIHFFQGELKEAFSEYEKALKTARDLNNQDLAARQEMNMGLVHVMSGRYTAGLEHLRSAAEVFRTFGNKGNYALALSNLSQTHLTLGEVDEAQEAAETALRISQEIKNPNGEIDALVQLGSVYFFRREVEQAVASFRAALEKAEQSEMTRKMAHIHLALVNVCFYCSNFKDCRHHATKALSIAKEIGEKSASILSRAGLAALEACEGLYHSGIRQLQEANRKAGQLGNVQMALQLKILLGQVLLKHGRTDNDREDGRSLLAEARAEATKQQLAPEIKLIEEIMPWNLGDRAAG